MAILGSIDSSTILYGTGLGLVVLPIVYYGTIAIYNLWFHPLAKYPGPRLAAATSWWYALRLMRGSAPQETLALHERYGPIVRISPNELSFVDPVTWKEIYGHRKPGEPELVKDEKYHAGVSTEPTLLNANREQHIQLRKALSHGFSEASLRLQEPVVQEYLEIFLNQLAEKGENGQVPMEMVSWYSYFLFDTVGYLTYGESFDCLRSSKYHLWIELFGKLLVMGAMFQAAGRLPSWLRKPFLALTVPSECRRAAKIESEILTAKVNYRLENTPPIPDFMGKLFDSYNSKSNTMSYYQLKQNSRILVMGGSETTSTALSAATYLLLKNPEVHERLKAEIRTSFESEKEINSITVNSCKYLLAVIEEMFRFHPPSPAAHARYTPPGGMMLAGHFIPGGVAVGITTWAIAHSSLNFEHPEKFIPERWLGEKSIYDHDRRDAIQPFSTGPRNCIGRNLANLEMKMVLAKLIWRFDLEDCTPGNWLDQKIFMVWEKKPLLVKLHPRKF